MGRKISNWEQRCRNQTIDSCGGFSAGTQEGMRFDAGASVNKLSAERLRVNCGLALSLKNKQKSNEDKKKRKNRGK